MLSSNNNLEGFISLFVSYWPLPTTMDAVSTTIVAGGRARIRLSKRLVKIIYFLFKFSESF